MVGVEGRQVSELSRVEADAEERVQRRSGKAIEATERHRAHEATVGDRPKSLRTKPTFEGEGTACGREPLDEPPPADRHQSDGSATATRRHAHVPRDRFYCCCLDEFIARLVSS